MKAPPPLLGFNNNVRHKGRVFHIQTEDSGHRHPHVITHLFADGGRILKTAKTAYGEHLAEANVTATVRTMMQEQHKAMIMALRNGQFDALFDDGSSGRSSSLTDLTAVRPSTQSLAQVGAPAAKASPVAEAAPLELALRPGTGSTSRPRLDLDPGSLLGPVDQAAAGGAPTMVEAAPTEVQAATVRGLEPAPRVPMPAPTPRGVPPELPPALDLDFDVLERASTEMHTPFFQQISDLPPPPAAVLGKKAAAAPGNTGSYRNVSPPLGSRLSTPIARKLTPSAGGRYAPSRPAAIFATARPSEGASIFGEDLISEKSLDEVILSYLAEDLEAPGQKK